MVTVRLRRTGNSCVVTIPREELERLGIHEGDMVGLEVRKLEVRLQMAPDVRTAFDYAMKEYAEDVAYLADK